MFLEAENCNKRFILNESVHTGIQWGHTAGVLLCWGRGTLSPPSPHRLMLMSVESSHSTHPWASHACWLLFSAAFLALRFFLKTVCALAASPLLREYVVRHWLWAGVSSTLGTSDFPFALTRSPLYTTQTHSSAAGQLLFRKYCWVPEDWTVQCVIL